MNLWELVSKEIRYRKVGFAIGLMSIAVAIASLVGAITLLRSHEQGTDLLLADREYQTRASMDRLEDDYRLIMRDLGYNVMILHREQSLVGLRSLGWPDTSMPQEYADMLGQGGIETLNHLFPVLQRGVVWPEYGVQVVLSGTPGQVPVAHKSQFLTPGGESYRNPIRRAIPAGRMELGHGVASDLELHRGDAVKFDGRSFVIDRVHPPQGDADDAMVWVDLETAQAMLSLPGRINAIFALECTCPDQDIDAIQEEVAGLLPDTQVLEFSSRVVARLQTRQRAEQAHREAIAAELEHRGAMAQQVRALAVVLVPLVMAGAGVWVFFTVLVNVREREAEIGILRAMGVGQMLIAGVFLLKAGLIGLGGAVAGYLVGVLAGGLWGGGARSSGFVSLFDPILLLMAVAVAVVLSSLAGWIPAWRAAGRDPAMILRKD